MTEMGSGRKARDDRKWAFLKSLFYFTKLALLSHDSKGCGGAVGVFYKFWAGVTLVVMTAQNL